MKKYLLNTFWIALTLILSGCTQRHFNLRDIKVPAINIPYLSQFKVDKTLPIIQNLKAKGSMREIVLQWSMVHSKEIAGYRILRYEPKTKSFIVIDTVNDPVATHYVDKDLQPNTYYRYRVSCYTKDGRVSLASKEVVAKTTYSLPPIQNLVAISNLPKKIKLTWSLYPQNKIIKYYAIYRSPDGTSNWENIGSENNSLAVEYIDYDIIDAKTYYYKVVGFTFEEVPTPPSNIAHGHSKPLPLTPKITVQPTTSEPRKIKIVWFDPNQNRKIVKYNIYTSYFKDALFTKHASTSKKYYIDNVQQDGKTVYYKVTAVDEDGLESPMPAVAAKGRTKENSSAPTITEYRLVDGRVVIKWYPPTRGIKSYTVIKKYYGKYFLPKTLKITDIRGTMYVDPDIKLGKTYKYQVIGIDRDGVPTKPSREIAITIK